MRIISQDGTLDYPYEESVIFRDERNEKHFIKIQLSGDTETPTVAEYSTEEKAIKAMEELRYAYLCHNQYKKGVPVPKGIELTKEMANALCGVFRFPKDKEVEP